MQASDPETPEPLDAWTSLDELIALRARTSPGHPFLEDARSDRVIDHAELARLVGSWHEAFVAVGIAPSGAVLVDVGDPLGFAVVHLAALSAGLRAIPIDTGQPVTETTRLADLLGGASLVVSDREDQATEGAGGAAAPSSFIDGVAAARIDTACAPADLRTVAAPTTNPDALPAGSVVLFTSGSTGTPKGVELPEEQLLFVARAVAAHNELSTADRGFNSLPLFHVNAEVVGLLSTLVAGATLVLDRRFRRTGFWELLAERRITWLNAVPAMLAVLAKTGPLDLPDGLRFVRSASAPLPDPVRAALGDTPLVVSWGMTEGASQITATPLGEPGRPGSVGVPVGSEVEVRAEDGTVLPAGEVGALWIRGPGIVHRYLFDRAAERFDADGWLSTGDIGSIADDGWVSLAGRSDDVINRGGEKVYPSEVEDVLLGDPRILEAVVVGRPDPILGHVPIAYVIRDPHGASAAASAADASGAATSGTDSALVDDLTARCAAHLTRFRRPVEIVVVPDLPRAPTGKVQRARVRAMATAE